MIKQFSKIFFELKKANERYETNVFSMLWCYIQKKTGLDDHHS